MSATDDLNNAVANLQNAVNARTASIAQRVAELNDDPALANAAQQIQAAADSLAQ